MAKLAFLIPNLQSGGVQKVVCLLANAMSMRGHDVDVVVLGETGELRESLKEPVEVVILGQSGAFASRLCAIIADPAGVGAMRNHLFAIRNRSKTLPYLPDLTRYLRRNAPDALFSATPYLNMDAVLARRQGGAKTRLLISERSHLSTGKPRKAWRAQKLQRAMAHCYRQADGIVAVSQGVADNLAQTLDIDRARITVLHNPTIPDDVAPLIDHPIDHPWFGVSDPPVLLTVGRPSFQKDYETLIRALGWVNQQRDVRLAIIGSTQNTPKRRRTVDDLIQLARALKVQDKVSFLGWRGNPYPYIARASMLVLSSRWEGLPNVLLEALACGTPIVSTDCPSGPHEILEGGTYGRLVPVGDDRSMARAIIDTLQAPPPRAHLLARARQFDRQSAIDGYERLLLPPACDEARRHAS